MKNEHKALPGGRGGRGVGGRGLGDWYQNWSQIIKNNIAERPKECWVFTAKCNMP